MSKKKRTKTKRLPPQVPDDESRRILELVGARVLQGSVRVVQPDVTQPLGIGPEQKLWEEIAKIRAVLSGLVLTKKRRRRAAHR